MKNLEGISVTEIPEQEIEKKVITEVFYSEEDDYSDCQKDNSQVEEQETYDDCYKDKNEQPDIEETYDDCAKEVVPFEMLIKLRNKLADIDSLISSEAKEGKYIDPNQDLYDSTKSMLVGLGKMYFDIQGDVSAEQVLAEIDKKIESLEQAKSK